MKKNIRFITFIFSVVFCLTLTSFGQETTGSLEITTRDTTGALVPGVTLTITSAEASNTAGFRRVVTTSDEGFQRVLQVPPGTYSITASANSGFAERRLDNVKVVLGKVTPVTVQLAAVGVTAEVVVTSDAAPIDTTDTKIQTNITSEVAELLPKGVSFSSLLAVSPATRPEPKSGGFQIDGSSGSENTFIIDGHEVTNAISGTLNANNDLPWQLVKEVQVKSSGFEAEYGGATGGVINVVTKGGNNQFSGELGVNFQPEKLQANPRPVLTLRSGPEYLQYNAEGGLNFFPSASLGGPIVKDHVWFFGSYTPQFYNNERTITYLPSTTTAATRGTRATYRRERVYEYAFGRIDAQPFSTLRMTGTYTWNPIVDKGEIPGITTQFNSTFPNNTTTPDAGIAYQDQLGGRQNSNITTGQIVWTPTNNFIFSIRGGHNFLNTKLGTYGRQATYPYSPATTTILCSTGGLTPPPSAGCVRGQSNGIANFTSLAFDATTRDTIDADATYIANFGGRHEFKGGYQWNRIFNEINQLDNAYIILRYGRPIDVYSGRNVTPSAPICAEGQTTGCVLGSGSAVRFGALGEASSTNSGIFFQDKWQPTRRLTLNLGIRAEKEDVPSFNEFEGISFDWQDKLAPRIGAAYDLTGDGKTKISGFFGWFYDRFKYELPRGSFGGNIYFQDYFEILPNSGSFTNFVFTDLVGGQTPPRTVGGNCPQTGFAFGRIRCSIDRRVPANDPTVELALGGGFDPDIKAYRQTELTFTFERQLSEKFVLAARYTRKKLDRAIEDVGFITATGSEAYIIGNPGLGLVADFYESQGFKPRKAVRDYDAFEVRLDRRFADDYYFNANYTWSRLYGNYSGLASSDEEGRTDPNVSRAFDAPFTEVVVATGENTLGLLPTDRTHAFKFAGGYSLDWNKRFGRLSNNTTEFSTFFTIMSGTPITTFADVAGYDNIILFGRGDMGRTEAYTNTDFAVRHRYRFGRDNRFTVVGEVDIRNLFNENNVTNIENLIDTNVYALTDPTSGLVTQQEVNTLSSGALNRLAQQRFQTGGAPAIVNLATRQSTRDPRYGLANAFQTERSLRFGFRFIF